MRVKDEGLPEQDWHAYLRQRDLRQISASNPGALRGPLLEIGVGSGVLTPLLRELAGEVVPTDIAPRAVIEGFVYADVTDLPFDDSEFQSVFSSNVLEHVDDLPTAMKEMERVLDAGGVMIHCMPTVSWKLLQLVTHPFGSAKIAWSLLLRRSQPSAAAARPGAHGSGERSGRGFFGRLGRAVFAPIHGVGSNHIDELMRFSKRRWIREFESANLTVESTENLYFHSPYRLLPYRLRWMREILSRIGLATARSYRVVPADRKASPEGSTDPEVR